MLCGYLTIFAESGRLFHNLGAKYHLDVRAELTKVLIQIILLFNFECCRVLSNVFIRRPNESLLFTSSMLWNGGCQSIEEFYNKCVGVPVELLPTVLGLKLAVDLELGSRYFRL